MRNLSNRIFATVVLVGAQLTLALYARAATYDVAADFSTNSNPNGVWSYGYATNLGGNLILYTDTSPSTTNVIWWRHNIAASVPAVFYNRSTNATTTADGTPHLAPHQAVFHPGPQNQYSIYRFTAPAAGTY
jgi:hypothetical protein